MAVVYGCLLGLQIVVTQRRMDTGHNTSSTWAHYPIKLYIDFNLVQLLLGVWLSQNVMSQRHCDQQLVTQELNMTMLSSWPTPQEAHFSEPLPESGRQELTAELLCLQYSVDCNNRGNLVT